MPSVRIILTLIAALVVLCSALHAEVATASATAPSSAVRVEAGVALLPTATEVPASPRGYALVCSLLALSFALQQAFFSRKPRRYSAAPSPAVEKNQAA